MLVQKLIGFLLLPIIWILTADIFAIFPSILIPSLTSVIERLSRLLTSDTFRDDLIATSLRWACGFFLGVFFGTLSGLIVGSSRTIKNISEFSIEFIRTMPVTAIFPLFLIFFGIGDGSKIAMSFTPTFLLMLINTSYGVQFADPARRQMAKVFGATRFQIFQKIVIMDALPQVFVGLRLALSQSLIVVIVSEMFIGTEFGLGQRVYDSYLTNSVTTLYSLLIVLGLIGYSANKILVAIERKVVFWK